MVRRARRNPPRLARPAIYLSAQAHLQRYYGAHGFKAVTENTWKTTSRIGMLLNEPA